MLRQSLRSLSGDPLVLLATTGSEATRRAEEIDIAGFVARTKPHRPLASGKSTQ